MSDQTEYAELALEHLGQRLRPIHRALREAARRRARAAERLARPDVTPLCITDDHVAALLDDVERTFAERDEEEGFPTRLSFEEAGAQEVLRASARERDLRPLPLDELTDVHALSTFEQDAILLCAAPELDSSYERIYGYILDDLTRRFPCVDLVCEVAARGIRQRAVGRQVLGPFGRLRRRGILTSGGEARTSLREDLRPAPGVVEYLIGLSGLKASAFSDPCEVPIPAELDLAPTVDRQHLAELAAALSGGLLGALAVFGPRVAGHLEVVRALGAMADRSIRRWQPPDERTSALETVTSLRRVIGEVGALGAFLWIAIDALQEVHSAMLREALDDALASCTVPLILTGVHHWRPATLLARRPYAELELREPGFGARTAMWQALVPELGTHRAEELAASFRLAPAEMRAATNVARTRSILNRNGHESDSAEHIADACATVTQRDSGGFVTVVKPSRGPEDLVLPPAQHRQVTDVARAFRAWPRVCESWGFDGGRGGAGFKVLFSGDSGTGKTLAAEVIAGMLGIQLLKVDLARVVSKWVGETEKNLETAFREGEQSNAVLFFDEADALFGKRGDSQSATDRYANLEVSFLLQRLESYEGLVILATNMKDQIDPAFTRRFHVVVRFSKPRELERREMWSIAFPSDTPLGADIDRELLAGLDLNGAGIAGAARTAALIAADEGADRVRMEHLVRAVQHQFDKEGRLLPVKLRGSAGG